MPEIPLHQLTRESFTPYGEVVDIAGTAPLAINQGFALRFNDLASVELGSGLVNISLFAAQPRPPPIAIAVMERHPLGSQLFYPLDDRPWLVLVCGDPHDAQSYRAFEATGRQGVNYAPNAWHHPLLALDPGSRFIIVDRKGPGQNLEEAWIGGLKLYLI